MRKKFGGLLAVFAIFAVLFGALKSLINWVANSGDDDHEIFADDDFENA